MKKFQPFGFFCILLVFLSVTLLAQDEPKDQLFWIHEEKAKVNMLDKYISTSKDILKMFKEGGLNVDMYTSQRDDNLFYYLIPISNFADIDSLYKNFGSAMKKVGADKWRSKMAENASTVEMSEDGVVTRSGKYSYAPKNPRLKQNEAKFLHWDYFYVLPEKRKEFFDVAKQFKELYAKNDIGMGYAVWIPQFGFDNDLVVVSQTGKDAADYYQASHMINEKLGKDGEMLWKKLLSTLKDFNHLNGHPRNDLSMMK
jgi:hypothetical protein